jgi:hypothetical protein
MNNNVKIIMPKSVEELKKLLEAAKESLRFAEERKSSESFLKRLKSNVEKLEKELEEAENLSESAEQQNPTLQTHEAGVVDNGDNKKIEVEEVNEEEVWQEETQDGKDVKSEQNKEKTEDEEEERETTHDVTGETLVIVEEDEGENSEEDEEESSELTDKSENWGGNRSTLLSSPSNFKKEKRKRKIVSFKQEEQTILIVGLAGSGKSTLGNALTEKENFNPEEQNKVVSTEKFSIKNEEKESITPYQAIDTPDFFEEKEQTALLKRKELLKQTLEIFCEEENKLNQIFLIVSNEDIDNADKKKKISKYAEWIVSLFPETDLKKHFSIVVTKFNDFTDETKCEERKQQLLPKLSLENEISSNIIFVDFPSLSETSGDDDSETEEVNKKIWSQSREKLIKHLKENSETYQPDDNFKTKFEELFSNSTKKKKPKGKQKHGEKETHKPPELKGLDIKTTIWVLVVIVIIYFVIYIVDQWKEINDFNSQNLIEEKEE